MNTKRDLNILKLTFLITVIFLTSSKKVSSVSRSYQPMCHLLHLQEIPEVESKLKFPVKSQEDVFKKKFTVCTRDSPDFGTLSLRIRCTANYPIRMILYSEPSKLNTTEEIDIISESGVKQDETTFSEIVDFKLPKKNGKYLAKCYSKEKCKHTRLQSALKIEFTDHILTVNLFRLPQYLLIEEEKQGETWRKPQVVCPLLGIAVLLVCTCTFLIFLLYKAHGTCVAQACEADIIFNRNLAPTCNEMDNFHDADSKVDSTTISISAV